MIRLVLGVLLLASIVPLARSADVSPAEFAQIMQVVQKSEVQSILFMGGMQRFAKYLQVTAVLKACGKTGLAKSVEVSISDTNLFLTQQMSRKDTWSDKDYAYLQGLTTAERDSMALVVSQQLSVYQFGYSQAVRVVKDQLPTLCDTGVKLADDLLNERSAK